VIVRKAETWADDDNIVDTKCVAIAPETIDQLRPDA
jgi:hypothetical protein